MNFQEPTDTIYVELEYPRCEGSKSKIQIGIMDVRVVDNLLLEYDFDRDGWMIKKETVFEWGRDDTICDPEWKEVAFVETGNE